jgi:hypothetical protein
VHLDDERGRCHRGRGPEHLGLLRRVGKHRQVAEHDHVGVRHWALERLDETLGQQDLVPTGGQRVAIEQPTIGIIRDEHDARHAVERIHVLTSCPSIAAAS